MHSAKNNVNWQRALRAANSVKRCGAKTRSSHPCKSPAMPNGRCRMHGGKSPGAPRGAAHGRYKHGRYARETQEKRREIFEEYRSLCSIYPEMKASASITLEDIGFDFTALETQADVAAALDEIWGAVREEGLTLQELTLSLKALEKKREDLLKVSLDKLLKHKHKIEMT